MEAADYGKDLEFNSALKHPPATPATDLPPALCGLTPAGSFTPAAEVGAFTPASAMGAFTPAAELGAFTPAAELGACTPAAECGAITPAADFGALTPAAEFGALTPASEFGAFSQNECQELPETTRLKRPRSPVVQRMLGRRKIAPLTLAASARTPLTVAAGTEVVVESAFAERPESQSFFPQQRTLRRRGKKDAPAAQTSASSRDDLKLAPNKNSFSDKIAPNKKGSSNAVVSSPRKKPDLTAADLRLQQLGIASKGALEKYVRRKLKELQEKDEKLEAGHKPFRTPEEWKAFDRNEGGVKDLTLLSYAAKLLNGASARWAKTAVSEKKLFKRRPRKAKNEHSLIESMGDSMASFSTNNLSLDTTNLSLVPAKPSMKRAKAGNKKTGKTKNDDVADEDSVVDFRFDFNQDSLLLDQSSSMLVPLFNESSLISANGSIELNNMSSLEEVRRHANRPKVFHVEKAMLERDGVLTKVKKSNPLKGSNPLDTTTLVATSEDSIPAHANPFFREDLRAQERLEASKQGIWYAGKFYADYDPEKEKAVFRLKLTNAIEVLVLAMVGRMGVGDLPWVSLLKKGSDKMHADLVLSKLEKKKPSKPSASSCKEEKAAVLRQLELRAFGRGEDFKAESALLNDSQQDASIVSSQSILDINLRDPELLQIQNLASRKVDDIELDAVDAAMRSFNIRDNENAWMNTTNEKQTIFAGNFSTKCFENGASPATLTVSKEELKTRQMVRLTAHNPLTSAQRIARILSVLNVIHEMLVQNRTATQREIFYRLKSDEDSSSGFQTQIQLNKVVEDIVLLLRVPRSLLGIFTTEKGLIAGKKLKFSGKTSQEASRRGLGISEDLLKKSCNIDLGDADFILVVEKDTVFYSLLDAGVCEKHNIVLLTAKGYPDVLTRKLLNKIESLYVNLPILYLGDCDPHGLHIFLTYCEHVKSLHTIGIHVLDVVCVPANFSGEDGAMRQFASLALTEKDNKMLERLKTHEGVLKKKELLIEVDRMLKGGRKYEVEALHFEIFKEDEGGAEKCLGGGLEKVLCQKKEDVVRQSLNYLTDEWLPMKLRSKHHWI